MCFGCTCRSAAISFVPRRPAGKAPFFLIVPMTFSRRRGERTVTVARSRPGFTDVPSGYLLILLDTKCSLGVEAGQEATMRSSRHLPLLGLAVSCSWARGGLAQTLPDPDIDCA